MPKTDAEWQALDARIARVMGFEQKEPHGEGALFWVSDDDEEYVVERPTSYAWMDWDIWQPHKNVAQAMLALRALLVKIGPHATAKIAMRPSANLYRVTIQNWVATSVVPAIFVRSPHTENEMYAICLATEACLNTQGMPDWAASG